LGERAYPLQFVFSKRKREWKNVDIFSTLFLDLFMKFAFAAKKRKAPIWAFDLHKIFINRKIAFKSS
jgi:hypothetical protein